MNRNRVVICAVLVSMGLCVRPNARADEMKICRAFAVASHDEVAAKLPDANPDSLLSAFTDAGTEKSSAVQIRAAVCYDKENLYLRIECQEPQMDKLRAQCTEHDGELFSDDCVEIFLSTSLEDNSYVHFAANSRGTCYEAKVYDKRWNGPWTVTASTGKDRSITEVAGPMGSVSVEVPSAEEFATPDGAYVFVLEFQPLSTGGGDESLMIGNTFEGADVDLRGTTR